MEKSKNFIVKHPIITNLILFLLVAPLGLWGSAYISLIQIPDIRILLGLVILAAVSAILVCSQGLMGINMIQSQYNGDNNKCSNSKYVSFSLSFILFVILGFSQIYGTLLAFDPSSFGDYFSATDSILTRAVDLFYFSVMTFTTVGYGDISPVSAIAKICVSIESLSFTVVISLIILNLKDTKNN